MFEEAGAFIDSAFKTTLKNSDRTSQVEKYEVAEMDPVVSSTIPMAAQRTDRVAGQLQNFRLGVVNLS